jgi:hypothetical protein
MEAAGGALEVAPRAVRIRKQDRRGRHVKVSM